MRDLQTDPAPVPELLELPKHDSAEYVRRSVANNLNDIAKDHPDVVIDTAGRWWPGADRDGRRMIRHALRTLITQGDAGALGVLGYEPNSPVVVQAVTIDPQTPEIGEKGPHRGGDEEPRRHAGGCAD